MDDQSSYIVSYMYVY